jgi:hydroxymethylbilane synthase
VASAFSIAICVAAEHAMLAVLDGSCRTPIAAHFELTHSGAKMAGEVLTDEGDRRWRAEGGLDHKPDEREAEQLGLALAEQIASRRGMLQA